MVEHVRVELRAVEVVVLELRYLEKDELQADADVQTGQDQQLRRSCRVEPDLQRTGAAGPIPA